MSHITWDDASGVRFVIGDWVERVDDPECAGFVAGFGAGGLRVRCGAREVTLDSSSVRRVTPSSTQQAIKNVRALLTGLPPV